MNFNLEQRWCDDNAIMVKKIAMMQQFNWKTFNCRFETSCDKLQNVSWSMSAVLRQSSPSNYGQVLNQVLKVSAFGMGAGSHTPLVDCIIRDILLLPLPQVNQPLRLVGYFTYLHLVNSLLHCAPGLLVDWIQISDIRRPQIWQKSVTFLDILLSQGNVATYCGWGGNLCRMKIGPLLGFLIFVRYCSNILRVRWKSLSYENRPTFGFFNFIRYCSNILRVRWKSLSFENRPTFGFFNFIRYCSNILRVRWKSLSYENRPTFGFFNFCKVL